MLVKWGTDRADEIGAPCVVESSLYAHEQQFYHGRGFKDVRHLRFVSKDESEELPVLESVFMYRPGKGEKWAPPSCIETVVKS